MLVCCLAKFKTKCMSFQHHDIVYFSPAEENKELETDDQYVVLIFLFLEYVPT
jgi:hypothetical protein